ncbi:MAG: glucuronate isomerase [Promethearchaeota archaeon]|nr:MAG: glucuronate isomerase [Candidatus Lokiarchaeota archaeon]
MFLDDDYLLTNPTARQIYQEIKDLPIIDAHNHADVKEIKENNKYSDIWQIEAATDHYVWELLRKRGVKEKYITGSASNKEKWMKMAEVFEDFVGNPVYEWIHLDLKRRFGIEALINERNAETIWNQVKELIKQDEFRPQALLEHMNVEIMCTTDDPLDSLEHHKVLKDSSCKTKILPTWRPDKAMQIRKEEFVNYIKHLGRRTSIEINVLADLIKGLQITHDHFENMGTKASDHGIEIPYARDISDEKANKIFQKRLKTGEITEQEEKAFKSYMLHRFGEMNVRSDWVMQLHIGAVRDICDSLYQTLGPDSGGDISNHLIPIVEPLKNFLNKFDGRLKIVLYVLDPNHYSTIATLTRAFGEKVNLGAAWWFNDSPIGMKRQLEYIGSVDLFMNFAGMVSDSRKLMSYGSRTEMFRRVLSDVLGTQVEKGQIPPNLALKTARYICYERKKQLFNF